jgi:hypothetical protein
MNSRSIFFGIIFLILTGIIFFSLKILEGKVPLTKISRPKVSEKKNSPLLDFVEGISVAPKPTSGGGILPEPPRARIKKAETLIKQKLKDNIKIEYALQDFASQPSTSYSLVVFAAPDPFRWRVDFLMNIKGKEYKEIYIFDGKTYFQCLSGEEEGCYKQTEQFLEKYLSLSLPLTQFLNWIFDDYTLVKFVPEIKQLNFKKETRTIASQQAKCKRVEDQHSILDFCLLEGRDILTYLDIKIKTASGKILENFTLEAQKIDFSPISQPTFTPPLPSK